MLWYPLSTYTLQCIFFKKEGRHNFTRQNDTSLSLAGSAFDEVATSHVSFLSDWGMKLTDSKTAPPLAEFPFSTAITWSLEGERIVDFTTAVNNVVYGSGEIERIIYNIAALDSSRDKPDYLYNATGAKTQEFYRLTYVPALVLVGLVCVILCSSLTIVLVLSVRHSSSWETFCMVDTVRLVVDAVAGGLIEEKAEFVPLVGNESSEVVDWAAKYYAGHCMQVEEKDGKGQSIVRLKPSCLNNRKIP